jgi:hypothetical protein
MERQINANEKGETPSPGQPLVIKRKLQWRHPVSFAERIGNDYFASCGATVLDVWQVGIGKIVHIFETKRDRIRALSLLVAKEGTVPGGGRVYLLSDEEKDGEHTFSVLCISHEPA